MGAYEYVALTADGRRQKGLTEADTAKAVRLQLRETGLIPLEVREAAGSERGLGHARRRLWSRTHVSARELALMTRQISTLVRSGLPVEEALSTAAQQNENPRLKKVLLAVRGKVMEGYPLALGFGEFPRVFPEIFRATVAAGEQSGHLDSVLERLADFAENRQMVRQKISLALVYPILLSGVSILIVVGLLIYVVPEIVTVFKNIGHRLPLLTRALIALSAFLRTDGVILLIGLAGASFLLVRLLRRPSVKTKLHRLWLRLPVFGRISRGINTAQFTRTLSILTGSGVPVLEALQISGQVITNIPMREAVQQATARVREGSTIHRALSQSRLFPAITVHLIASGESSGKLELMLERASMNQEKELESMIGTLLSILEPMMILIMGGIVLTIVLAILLPIFELNRLIH
jgi:general secretion pathway protein F